MSYTSYSPYYTAKYCVTALQDKGGQLGITKTLGARRRHHYKRCKTLPDKKQGSDERVADFAMALKKSFKLEDYFPNEEAMPAVLYLTKNVLNEVAPF